MIARDLAPRLTEAAQTWPAITLTGPRQSGKTTLCRALFPQHQYETLEAPDVRAFAAEDPRAFLAQFPQGAVLDEVQRVPDLLPTCKASSMQTQRQVVGYSRAHKTSLYSNRSASRWQDGQQCTTSFR